MTLAERLKRARENANFTQLDVKKGTGINNKSISNWEHEVSSPSPEDLKILAELYGVTTDYLIGHTPSFSFSSPQSPPTNATRQEQRDLDVFLKDSEVIFDGTSYKLSREEKAMVHKALEYAFWDINKSRKMK